jgi:hypothetical protein
MPNVTFLVQSLNCTIRRSRGKEEAEPSNGNAATVAEAEWPSKTPRGVLDPKDWLVCWKVERREASRLVEILLCRSNLNDPHRGLSSCSLKFC